MRTKRVSVSQAMTASIGEKRKRPKGKIAKESLVILCTTEELNHVLDKWIRDGIVRPFTVSRPPTEEERKNPLFCRIPMSSTLPITVGPFVGFFTRSLEREP